jgi:hypothetical protein
MSTHELLCAIERLGGDMNTVARALHKHAVAAAGHSELGAYLHRLHTGIRDLALIIANTPARVFRTPSRCSRKGGDNDGERAVSPESAALAIPSDYSDHQQRAIFMIVHCLSGFKSSYGKVIISFELAGIGASMMQPVTRYA